MSGRYEGLTPAERVELDRLDAEATEERRLEDVRRRFREAQADHVDRMLTERHLADLRATDPDTAAKVEDLMAVVDTLYQPRRGRPRGRAVTEAHIVETFRRLRDQAGRPPTQADLAANLKPPVEIRTLQVYLREYGLNWPIE